MRPTRENRNTSCAPNLPENPAPDTLITPAARRMLIAATLLTLFLGAMDTLIMSAAMPTIVADLGGLHLYSWAYSAYMLVRAVSLPIFGKLADLYKTRTLFMIAVGIFVVSSVAAGCATSMGMLIFCRVVQGIGAGGNFALVYIVLADISSPAQRGRTLSLASSVWGIASVLGPSLGGFIVTWFSWRWIFFINLPLGLFCLVGIGSYLVEVRPKKRRISLDIAGVVAFAGTVLSLLLAFMLGGRTFDWYSPQIMGLLILMVVCGVWFYRAERKAPDPILSIEFFANRGFSTGNGAVFFSSFAVFSLFAFAPLYIQGALGQSPMAVGTGMLSLSLGWSLGSLLVGQIVNRLGPKNAALAGALCLVAGSLWLLDFSATTSMTICFLNFMLTGLGMGFVALATLLVVQNALSRENLGVATASNQLARTIGGTVGIGLGGGFMATRMAGAMEALTTAQTSAQMPTELLQGKIQSFENILRPEVQSLLAPELQMAFKTAVLGGVTLVFWSVLAGALLCLLICLALPVEKPKNSLK